MLCGRMSLGIMTYVLCERAHSLTFPTGQELADQCLTESHSEISAVMHTCAVTGGAADLIAHLG